MNNRAKTNLEGKNEKGLIMEVFQWILSIFTKKKLEDTKISTDVYAEQQKAEANVNQILPPIL